ncbi:MAG TPA: histidinol-phosphate transaminase [Phycisphaerae bacterium]|nr:histidinol-phosphate transaminase [Phycisphaerae bacterium]
MSTPPLRQNVLASPGYTPGEQPADTSTIKLNTNENPYPPSPRVLDAIRAITPDQLRRYPNPNARPFREAAAKIHNLPPDWIMAFNGGDEFLSVAIRAAAAESDAVAFLDPSYSLYPILTQINGSRALKLPYTINAPLPDANCPLPIDRAQSPQSAIGNQQPATPSWSLPDNIEQTPAKLLLIVNPNAPSGHLDPLDRLAHIAQNFNGLLLIDEAYVDFAPHSALPLVQKFPNVLLLRTMSKGYSLAGLRFGYAIANPDLLRQLEKVRDSYPVDALAIAAATAAIEDQPYARDTWQKVIAERARLAAELRALGFSMPDSHSNFLLATVPPNRIPAKSLYESLKARGILVRYWDLPRIADKLRITIGTPDQNNRLLAELKNFL